MRKQDDGYDYRRYWQLLAEAVDETRRQALIALLIEEKARDRLAAERASDRAALTAMAVARVLGTSRVEPASPDRASARMRFKLPLLRSV